MLLLKLSLISCLILNIYCDEEYVVPAPKFELLKPMGFRVSIPDEMGIQLFAFHGNVNREMEHLEAGQMSTDIIKKRNGRWVYENNKTKLKKGDTIYFWLFVIKHGKGYRYDDGSYYCNIVPETNGYYKKHSAQGYHHKQKRGIDSDSEDEGQEENSNLRNRGYFPDNHRSYPLRKPNRFPPFHPQAFDAYGPPRPQHRYGTHHAWGHGYHRYPYDDSPRHGYNHHHHHHHHCDGKSNENDNSNESGFTESATNNPITSGPTIPTAPPTMVPTAVPTPAPTPPPTAMPTPPPPTPVPTLPPTTNTQAPFPDIDIRFGGT